MTSRSENIIQVSKLESGAKLRADQVKITATISRSIELTGEQLIAKYLRDNEFSSAYIVLEDYTKPTKNSKSIGYLIGEMFDDLYTADIVSREKIAQL